MVQSIVEKYMGSHSHIEQGEQYFYRCPKCKSSRFTINYNKNRFKCWKCKYSSLSVISLLYDLKAPYNDISKVKKLLGIRDHYSNRDTSLQRKLDEIIYSEEKKIQLYEPDSWVPINRKIIPVLQAKKYLIKDRGISSYELNYYNIKYDTSDGMIVFPSYDIRGDLNFYVKRTVGVYSYYVNCKDVKKTDIVFWESLIDFERPIILTEGIIDAIKIGDNALPILGSILPNRLYKLMLAYETPKVTVFLDGDAEESMIKMTEKLFDGGLNVERVFLNKDVDAGGLHKNEVHKYISNAKRLNKFTIMEQNLNSI